MAVGSANVPRLVNHAFFHSSKFTIWRINRLSTRCFHFYRSPQLFYRFLLVP